MGILGSFVLVEVVGVFIMVVGIVVVVGGKRDGFVEVGWVWGGLVVVLGVVLVVSLLWCYG